MKKTFLFLLTVFLCQTLLFIPLTRVSANDEILIIASGTELLLEEPAQSVNDRTMVTLNTLGKILDAEVEWHELSQSAGIKGKIVANKYRPELVGQNLWMTTLLGFESISFCIYNHDYSQYLSDPEHKDTDSPPVVINNTPYFPLRIIAEIYGYTVDWNEETKTVLISH